MGAVYKFGAPLLGFLAVLASVGCGATSDTDFGRCGSSRVGTGTIHSPATDGEAVGFLKFSDQRLKDNLTQADTASLLRSIEQVQLREYDYGRLVSDKLDFLYDRLGAGSGTNALYSL